MRRTKIRCLRGMSNDSAGTQNVACGVGGISNPLHGLSGGHALKINTSAIIHKVRQEMKR